MNPDGIPLPSALSGEIQERIVSIDKALLFLVTGALTDLADRWQFEQTGSLTPEAAKDAISAMLWCFMAGDECAVKYPENFDINIMRGRLGVGGAMSPKISNLSMTYHYQEITPYAINNRMDFDIFCKAGTYLIGVLAPTASNQAQTRLLVDGSASGGLLDWYAPATTWNIWKSTSVNIPTDGQHTLGYKAESKNASSSTYAMLPCFIYGYRTGDPA